MKRFFQLSGTILLMLVIMGCGSDPGGGSDPADDSSEITISSTIDTSAYKTSVASTAADSGYDTADLVANTAFSSTVTINFTALTVQTDSGTAQDFSTTSVTALTGVTVTKTSTGAAITNTSTTIVKYILTGTLSGTLTVTSASANYQLYMNGVTISGGSTGPAVYLASTTKAFIVLADGTTNTLSDTSTRTSGKKAAFYGSGPIVFSGTGTLSLSGNYKHGIFCDDYIRVCEGTLNVSVTAKNAIQSVNGFFFDDGTLTISATGTTTDDESKGIKVEGSENSPGEGYIYINGGTINITSVSKAITASWDIDEDADTTSTADDPDPYVVINNGVINIKTTGTSYEYDTVVDGVTTTVSCSPEGIEGKSSVTINSGYIEIVTTDDCINAGNSITINGGYIYAYATANDAIDSNGTMTITGGVVVAKGANGAEGGLDCDENTFRVSGGTFIGLGGRNSTVTSATQCTMSISSLNAANTLLYVADSSGNPVFAFYIPSGYTAQIALLSAPSITRGNTYKVYTGGTITYTSDFNGLYLGTLSLSSAGSIKGSYTYSSSNYIGSL